MNVHLRTNNFAMLKRVLRRAVITFLAGVSMFTATGLFAADYPTKTVRILVGFAPGAITDIVGRMIADGLSKNLGQPVIVENRVGANGEIAYAELMRSPPDGHTLMISSAGLPALPVISKTFRLDPIKDFSHIAILAQAPYVLAASGAMPFDDVKGLIAYAKANPGKLNFGFGASVTNLDFFPLWKIAGISVTPVPYNGITPAIASLLNNDIQLAGASHRAISQFLAEKKLKAIGFASPKRFFMAPNVPTLAEGVPGFTAASVWLGISGPKGMSGEIVAKLNKEVNAIIKDPANMRKIMDQYANEVVGGSPQDMVNEIKLDYERYVEAARLAGFKPE
jgi:tripartite-type tricarboxylate transporter receptor subunit TctC